MNLVDVFIVVIVLALAAIGYGRGLIASALPLAGFVAGAFAGARLGQALLAGGAESEYAPLIGVLGGVFGGIFVAVALDGVARVVRARLHRGRVLAGLDGIGGAALFALLGLLVAWALGAVAINAPGPETRDVRQAAQRSTILGKLNDVMPPSGPLLNVLHRIDPRREIAGPPPRVGPPDRGIIDDPEIEQAAASTVRVLGTACGMGIAGSGWVAEPEIVVTNAHVVAGQGDTTVTAPDGGSFDAEVVHYQPRNDLAILRVPGLGAPPLPLLGAPDQGTPGAAIGYPQGGSLTAAPARLGITASTLSQDSYGRGPVRRQITSFRGRVRSGHSGGPVVDDGGGVLTTVFAAAQNGRPPSGLGVPNRVVRKALEGDLGPTATGPCVA